MRAGLPVVASDVGGVREAVIDGENGFLTSPTDTGAFRRALELLLSDTRLRHRMAKKSRHLFEQRFTAERMLQKTFGVYRMAVPEGAAEYNLPVLETGEQA
jgi:glycosyltransferase involved in cell wall biosynthesis